MHSTAVLLLIAVAVPVVVFAAAVFMSWVSDWTWRTPRKRAWVMLATGSLYLAFGVGLLLTGEPWPKGAFFAAAGVASAAAGLFTLVEERRE